MKNLIKVLLLAIIIIIASMTLFAQSGRWAFCAIDNTNEKSYYVDTYRITMPKTNNYNIWIKQIPKYESYYYINEIIADISTNTYQIKSSFKYEKDTGACVENDVIPSKVYPLTPDSIGETVVIYAVLKYNERKK